MPETLVILHGWGSDLSRWQPIKAILSQKLPVLLPRLPDNKVRNTADFADWVFKKTKTFKPFYLLGHSFGGQIAINFTNRYPNRVKKMILVGSAGIRRRSWKSCLLPPLAKLLNFLPRNIKYFFYRLLGETDYIKAGPVMQETMKLILREDQQAAMKKIKAPTMIIWGRNDRYTPFKDGQLTHSLIKKSLFTAYDGGHGLPFTHVQKLAGKILWFLK